MQQKHEERQTGPTLQYSLVFLLHCCCYSVALLLIIFRCNVTTVGKYRQYVLSNIRADLREFVHPIKRKTTIYSSQANYTNDVRRQKFTSDFHNHQQIDSIMLYVRTCTCTSDAHWCTYTRTFTVIAYTSMSKKFKVAARINTVTMHA